MNQHIGIYGGSFDPPHCGHVMVASYILNHTDVSHLLIVPCADHPFEKKMSSFNDRLAMCRIAFRNFRQDRLWVSDIESSMASPSYTIKTIRALMRLNPGAWFTVFVGSDVYENIDKWHEIEELRKLCSIKVIPRRDTDHDNQSSLFPVVSSSLVRKMVTNRQDVSFYEPTLVDTYIREQRLYREE